MKGVCVPTVSENSIRLSPVFADYFGDQVARFTERTDIFAKLGCYVPRFYHSPGSAEQLAGVAANGYLTYLLSLPVGSFILGFVHTTSSAPGSAPDTSISPPAASGFSLQITDLAINHKWFSRPVDEAYFLNDYLLPVETAGFPPYPLSTFGYTFPSLPRLLPVPYPVVGVAQFMIEFWNKLDGLNNDCQVTFLVMVPNGGNLNAGSNSGK
jgi:hypothetical protein